MIDRPPARPMLSGPHYRAMKSTQLPSPLPLHHMDSYMSCIVQLLFEMPKDKNPQSSRIQFESDMKLQGSAKRWALGCVNPASWLRLAAEI